MLQYAEQILTITVSFNAQLKGDANGLFEAM